MPHGWFPYYAEWIISFPRAPLGSVSVASWQLACAGVISLFGELIMGIYGLVYGAKQQPSSAQKMGGAAKEERKEL